jgi:hypothetical protein
MTMDELFNHITQIIARPDTEITEKHKVKAIQILCGVEDYLIDAMPGYCSEDCEVDIGGYLGTVLDAMDAEKAKEELDKTGVTYLNDVLIVEEF